MNDLLDDQIKQLIGRVVTTAPTPPTEDTIASRMKLDAARSGTRSAQRNRWIVGGAAVLAAAAVVTAVLVTDHEGDRVVTRPAAAPDPVAIPYTHVLPTFMPDGYVLRSVDESISPAGATLHVQRFERSDHGASIVVAVTVPATPYPGTGLAVAAPTTDVDRAVAADVPRWDAEGQVLAWVVGGDATITATATVDGLDETETRALVGALRPVSSNVIDGFETPTGYVNVGESQSGPSSDEAVGTLTFTKDDRHSIFVMVSRRFGPLDLPSGPGMHRRSFGGRDALVGGQSLGSMRQVLFDLDQTTSVVVIGGGVSDAVLERVVAGLQPSTSGWDVLRQQLVDRISSWPVMDQEQLGAVTVTRRRATTDAPLDGYCLEDVDSAGVVCVDAVNEHLGGEVQFFEYHVLLDGQWWWFGHHDRGIGKLTVDVGGTAATPIEKFMHDGYFAVRIPATAKSVTVAAESKAGDGFDATAVARPLR